MIHRKTPQRATLDSRYARRKAVWTRLPENRYCIVAEAIGAKRTLATDVHHQRGKVGPLYLDERFWLPVSRAGHRWIHDHPRESRALGLIGGPWNHQPGPEVGSLDRAAILRRGAKAIDKILVERL